jgi:hypothetical protein
MKFKFCFQNFVVPENLMRNNFEGNVKVLGDANGVFKVIYVNAIDEELINEAKGCLSNSPKLLQRIMVQFIQIQYHHFNSIKC